MEVLDINNKEHFFIIQLINTQNRTRSQEGTGVLPYLEILVDVKFDKGANGFHYKTSFKEQYQFCSFVKKTVKIF